MASVQTRAVIFVNAILKRFLNWLCPLVDEDGYMVEYPYTQLTDNK